MQHLWSKYILAVPYADTMVFREAVGYVTPPLSASS